MRRVLIAAAWIAGLAAPAAASAHVGLVPSTAPAGDFARIDVRVPNERDDAGTTKVEMQLPPGVVSVRHEPVRGWRVQVREKQLETPIKTDDGFEVDRQVDRITWTGDGREGLIEPGQFQDFGLSLRVPGKTGDVLAFKALQTYEGGEVVRWIGPEDADEPAPTLSVTAASAEGGHGVPGAAAGATQATRTSAPVAPAADDGPSDALVYAALAAGVLGLLAGLAGFVTARRARITSNERTA
jgi:uncharacterized protein YcnI